MEGKTLKNISRICGYKKVNRSFLYYQVVIERKLFFIVNLYFFQNSIRHNLSLYDTFIRQKSSKPGQSGCSYWTLRDDDMGVAFFSRPALMEVNSPEKQTKSGTTAYILHHRIC